MNNLATTWYAAGKLDLALPLLVETLEKRAEAVWRDGLTIREQKRPDAWTTFGTRSLLGASLLGQKKYAAAEPLLQAGYEGLKQHREQIPAASKLRLVEAAQRLVDLYQAWDQPEAAVRWRETVEAA
jgi:hypothetical protein